MANLVGQRLGDYRLLQLLGSGTFSEVYLGESIPAETMVAVKVLRARLGDREVRDFINEVRSIRIQHPHIVSIRDFGIAEPDIPFIVEDYAPGGNLRQRHPKGTQVALDTIVQYVNQIASALQYAHDSGLVHRDVKPENLLLGQNEEVLLSDFGIAIQAHSTSSLKPQSMAGTPGYMAPEQIMGKAVRATDQYALGVVVYEWLEGESPFQQGNFHEIIAHHLSTPPPPLTKTDTPILQEVEAVVMKALEKEPGNRFASVQEFALALESAYLSTKSQDSSQNISSQVPRQQQGGDVEENQKEAVKKLSQDDPAAAEPPFAQPTPINQTHTHNIISGSIAGDSITINQGETIQISSSSPSNQTLVFPSSASSTDSLKDFFISYNNVDREIARWVAFNLQQAGYSVFLPPVDFREGFIFRKEMQKALVKAKRMVVIYSPGYLNALKSRSTGISAFKRALMDERGTLLAVCIHSREHIFAELSGVGNYIDITGESDAMAQVMLLAYVRNDSIELPTSFSLQSDPIYASAYEMYSTPTSTRIIQQVRDSFAKKDWPDVTRKVDFLIKQHPNMITPKLYRMHGLAHVELGHNESAYESLQAALTLANDRERPGLLEDCVKVLTTLNRWNEVLAYTKEALQFSPSASFWLTIHQEAITQLAHNGQAFEGAATYMVAVPPLPTSSIEIFFSYSHRDEEMRQELEKHLSGLKRQRIITGWHDGEIRAGDVWEEEVNTHLSSASIILLLVSPDFLESNYCYEKEMMRAMERHRSGEACVIPVILRPAHWERTPFGKLQALPLNAKPITLWPDRDEAFVSIAKGIQKVADKLAGNFTSSKI